MSTPETSSHTISVLVDNEPGILARVVAAGTTRHPDASLPTILPPAST